MAKKPAQAFLSYAHADDESLDGGITWLCRELQRGMRALTGEPFEIFQDADSIAFGEHWPSRIEEALEGARFLIPILSPSYFTSPNCCAEAAAFLDLEHKAERQDLILPIYLIEADILENAERRDGNAIARIFHERQYTDWRNAAFELRSSPRIKQRAFDLAKRIKAASERVAKDAPPQVPAQGSGIRFGLDKDGKLDRAPDEPSEVTDDDPRLCSLQEGLQDACDRFLGAFGGKGGDNAFGRLIDNVRAYRDAVTGPLTEIQYTDIYRHGLTLQNQMLARNRDAQRLDPPPPLEDDQEAAITDLLSFHGPFIRSTKEGEVLQAKADQDQMAAVERASLWSPELSEAAEASDHATERVKAILRDVNRPSEDGAIANRRALLALSTNRNFLSASGEAATGKIFVDVDEDAAAKASHSAGRFLLENEKLISKLATAAPYGLGWLGRLIGWLKTPAAKEAPSAPTITTKTSRPADTVFREIDEPWCPEMVVIPAGEFMMGSPEDEKGRFDAEGPQHLVMIERLFVLGRYPVTFDEFDFFCDQIGQEKPNDEGWGRGRRPVINVSWDEAEAYCVWLSKRTGGRYRLPSEAEWEYACRAGSTAAYAFGETIDKKQANFDGDVGKTSEVGAYPANVFKLFDMHGNVFEWCADHFRDSYADAPTDGAPLIFPDGTIRVVRGGSWLNDARDVRSAYRGAYRPGFRYSSVGFRCAGVQE